MKTVHQILYFLIITLLFSTTLNASQDASVKKQCQYLVYGYGDMDYTFEALLIGYMNGILYATPTNYRTKFSKRARGETLIRKACSNALENITQNGFEADYRLQLFKLINNQYKYN